MREPRHIARGPLAIRPVTPGDLDAVIAVQRASFPNPWSPDLLRRELSHEWSCILVAELPGPGGRPRMVGFVIFWLVHDEVHVLNVAVLPEDRRRGIARALMEAAIDRGRANRASLVTLEVRRGNAAALQLYRSMGFRAVGVRPNYYADDGEDAVVMLMNI